MEKHMNSSGIKDHLYVVILCGGGGTRVWPLSVNKKPKQFMKFYSDKTLFQETVARALKLTDISRIVVITNEQYVGEIQKEVPELAPDNIIAEPAKKNTALAMGVAAAFVYQKDPDGVIVNLASDHVITDPEKYVITLTAGAVTAYHEHKLMAIGITPTFAHSGLGYIHKGEKVSEVDGLPLSKVVEFKEKPTVEVAQQFVSSGEYLWNANNYIWRCDDILEAFDSLSPQIARYIRDMQPSLGTQEQAQTLARLYPQAPEEQIDTAISERSDNLYVLPGDFGWNDVGGWQVVYDLGSKDQNKNVVIKDNNGESAMPVILQESQGNLVYAGKQPIAILGLSDIVVIDTGMGLLICDRNKCNDVKKIVQQLQEEGYSSYI